MCTQLRTNKLKSMPVIEVTSREFREKQKTYLELADKGERILIRRKGRSYIITACNSGDVDVSPEMAEKIDRAIESMRDGKVTKLIGKKAINDYLKNL